jgi:hypothetical protein
MKANRLRRIIRVILSVLAALVAVGLICLARYNTWPCGKERWPVKSGMDPDAVAVDPTKPVFTLVSEMNRWPRPDIIRPKNRVNWVEKTVWQLYATMIMYKLLDNGSYHVVLQDDDGSTMIVEIPSPACVSKQSPFYEDIVNARTEMDAMFTVTRSFRHTHTPMIVTGVGFWDSYHNQAGRARNLVELNPVLDIQFP